MQAGIIRIRNGSTTGPSPFKSGASTTLAISGTGNGARMRPFQLKRMSIRPFFLLARGRRWHGRSPCRMRGRGPEDTPHPPSLRSGTLSYKGRGEVRTHTPPILQTYFHSSAVTGCTDSREYFTSAIAASFLSALIAAIVTGVFRGLSALMSTQTNFSLLSVGSG